MRFFLIAFCLGVWLLQQQAALPAARTLALVSDGKSNDDLSFLSLPRGSDLFGWIRVEQAGAVMDLAADAKTEAAANALVARAKPTIDDLFANTNPDSVGKLEVVRDKTVVHVRGNITALMMGLVTAGLSL